MRHVYRQAQKVITYVPQESDDIEPLNKLIRIIIRAGAHCRKVIESGPVCGQQEAVEDPERGQDEKHEQHQGHAAATSVAPRIEFKMLYLNPAANCIEDYHMPEDDPVWVPWKSSSPHPTSCEFGSYRSLLWPRISTSTVEIP